MTGCCIRSLGNILQFVNIERSQAGIDDRVVIAGRGP